MLTEKQVNELINVARNFPGSEENLEREWMHTAESIRAAGPAGFIVAFTALGLSKSDILSIILTGSIRPHRR